MLGSFLTLTSNAGMLFGFAVGTYLEYYTQLKVLILLPIAFLITFNYFPESPAFLRKQKNQIVCKMQFELNFFFTNFNYRPLTSRTVFSRASNTYRLWVNWIRRRNWWISKPTINLPPKRSRMMGTWHSVIFVRFYEEENYSENVKMIWIVHFTVKPAAKKAIFIGIMLTIGNQMCGAWPLMTYTQAIFHEAGSSVSPNVCAIVASISQLTANLFAALLAERIDRKKLFSSSAICMGLGLIAMGLHSIYKEQLTHLGTFPVIAFSFAIFTASCGILPLHYVVLAEIMPKKVSCVQWISCGSRLVNGKLILLFIFRFKTSPTCYAWHYCG